MKIYRFGHGYTLAWFSSLIHKKDKNMMYPVIVFTKNKKSVSPDKLGTLCFGRKLSLWEYWTSTWFVFPNVDALRFWLESMLTNIERTYPKEEQK